MDNFALLRMMQRLQMRAPPVQESDLEENPGVVPSKSKQAREEAILEAKIVRKITAGQWEDLLPNTGKAVAVGEHHVCVGFQEEPESGYRTWEWHGHLLLYDEEKGYVPEYVYGNYFQLMEKKTDLEDASIAIGIGLGGIIDANDSKKHSSVLHRSLNFNPSNPTSYGD
eukprot:c20259_g1_i1 orf=291-797(-)